MKELDPVSLRILAVDDEQNMLDTYHRVFCREEHVTESESKMKDLDFRLFGEKSPEPSNLSFDVMLCQQGDKAVEAVRVAVEKNHPFAVAFVDVRLPPGPDGVRTAERIRALDPNVQIVMVTAYSDMAPSEIANRVLPKDKLLYVQKPLFPREIEQFATALGAKWSGERRLLSAYERTEERVVERTRQLAMLNEQLKVEISEHKSAVTALQESEKKFRELYEDAPTAYFTIGTDNVVSDCNRMAESLSGYARKELIGKDFFDLLPETSNSKARAKKAFHSFQGPGAIHHERIQMVKKDGSLIWGSLAVKNTSDGNGRTIGSRCMVTDITDRVKLEAQFQQAQKMEAIGTLAGGIAHDFNNILSAIIGYSEMAVEDAPKDSLLERDLGEVLQAGARAKDLVKQILTFSRQTENELKPIEVKIIVKEALKLLRASLPTTIEIRQDIESDSLVLANPTQVHQVLMNLCTNAGHAMEEKGGVLDIALTDVELDSDFMARHPDITPGLYLKLVVSDTGYGMDRSTMDRIFDPYFTTKQKGDGTGLGLAVVQGIVKNHGGLITVYSEKGKGTTFSVHLPVIDREVRPTAEPEESLPMGTERVLFIDDEQPLVNLGKQMLESLGYEVMARTSSIEALELFKVQHDTFDLVITDMTMPNMTGDKLAGELLKIRKDIPVIIFTGFSARITEERAKALGIRALAMKPFLKRDMAKTIRKVLDE